MLSDPSADIFCHAVEAYFVEPLASPLVMCCCPVCASYNEQGVGKRHSGPGALHLPLRRAALRRAAYHWQTLGQTVGLFEIASKDTFPVAFFNNSYSN